MISLKLAFLGLKGKLKDYLILFSGLIISIGVFYMFQSLAHNASLNKSTQLGSVFTLIFHLGTILLIIITLVYFIYANTFLLNLKRKLYAIYMMLGANKSKISLLFFTETISIGILTIPIGLLIGMGLTVLVNQLLIKTLAIHESFILYADFSSVLSTCLFFSLCFLFMAIMNVIALSKNSLISLLKKQENPEYKPFNYWLILTQSIAGLFFLSIAYYLMIHFMQFKFMALIGILIIILLGTYFTIHSLTILLLGILQKNNYFYFNRLNSVFIAQLTYRISNYTQVLSIVSLLFALALGALTVGVGFKNEAYEIADGTYYYDLVINNAKSLSSEKLSILSIQNQTNYSIKEDAKSIYFLKEDFKSHPFIVNQVAFDGKINQQKFSATTLEKNPYAMMSLRSLLTNKQQAKEILFLPRQSLNKIKAPSKTVTLIKTTNFKKNLPKIKQLIQYMQPKKSNSSKDNLSAETNQKYSKYQEIRAIMVGFEYMGFFLSFSFLVMLISCLLFKILSGVTVDKNRYLILSKLGASKKEIKHVVFKELLATFLLPAILGVIDVLFGLQLFRSLLLNPYQTIIFPILIFLMVYIFYFLITYTMYIKSLFSHFKY